MARFRSCLVVTYGRSGSTLLQGVLNTIPGWLIRGENEHFVSHLLKAYGALQTAAGTFGNQRRPSEPWFGVGEIDFALLREDLGRLIRNVLVPQARQADTRCFGFKEIRYVYHPAAVAPLLDFLHEILPDLGVIFNFRDIDAVLRSDWWRKADPDDTRAMLLDFERAALAYMVEGRAPSFLIRYDELIRRGAALHDLFAFLDEAPDAAALDRVFAITHSTITPVAGAG